MAGLRGQLPNWPRQMSQESGNPIIEEVKQSMKTIERLNHSKIAIRRSFRAEHAQSNPIHRRLRAQAFGRLASLGARQFLRKCSDCAAVLFGALALVCSACAGSSNPVLSSGPHPRVEDCALVQQATPTRYFCDGKIYTSVQLDEISKGQQVQLSEQASHGALPGNVIGPTGNFGTYRSPGSP
jgi:hypothetical protein